MNMSKTILFFGTEAFSLTALKGLVEAGYRIAAVVTKPDSISGRHQKSTPPVVKTYATEHDIPVWQPNKLFEIHNDIVALGDVVGVLVSYGKIIPASIIDLFNPGIINVHPSLLPMYRGPSPIESAIKDGLDETGVSIMQLTPKMDAGPVYAHIRHPLTGTEVYPLLYQTLANAGIALLLHILPAIIDGSLLPSPQNDNESTYCQLLDKKDALLQPDKITATEAERLVRAYLDFPRTKIGIGDNMIIITKSHVSSNQRSILDVPCMDGEYLSIDELIAPSGKTMSASAFLNGYAAG
jgi:methionyl-tRNA formyltransferase